MKQDRVNSIVEITKEGLVRQHIKNAKSAQQVQKIAEILKACKKKGVQVPEVVGVEDRVLVTRFIKGEQYNGSASQLQYVAQELALLHKALAGCRIQYTYEPNGALYKYFSQEEMQRIHKKAIKNKSSEFDNIVLQNLDLVKKLYVYTKGKVKKMQLIHFDMQPGNVLFNGNRVAALLDFGAMRKGEIMQDISFGAFRFGKTEKEVHMFLKSYSPERKIGFQEAKEYFIAEELRRISALLRQYYFIQKPQWNSQELKKHIRLIKKWM